MYQFFYRLKEFCLIIHIGSLFFISFIIELISRHNKNSKNYSKPTSSYLLYKKPHQKKQTQVR